MAKASIYDNPNGDVKPMAERLREYYDPADFVVVMNCDKEDFVYVIQRPENVIVNQPSPISQELYYAKEPDTITLTPGETRLCPAYEADWMIDQLVKKIVNRNRGVSVGDGKTPTESHTDPGTQHKYISSIYQGKKDFMSEYNEQLSQDNSNMSELEKDLDDAPTHQTVKTSPGRPKKAVA